MNPQSWNRYYYVQNNPIRYNDPTEHKLVENEFGGNKPGCSDPVYCRDGKPKPFVELKPKSPQKDKSFWDDPRQGAADTLYLLGSLSQDLATFGDAMFVVGTTGVVTAGCMLGGGAGCIAAAIEMEIAYISGYKQVVDLLSFASLAFTVPADVIDDGRLGQNSATSFTTVALGTISFDPLSSLALNANGSGYNHGVFNGVIDIANGQPLIKER